MEAGFPLCGWLPTSRVFPCRIRPPEISEEFLRQMAGSFTARTLASTKSSGDDAFDDALWAATMDEVRDGFLTGPYDASEVPRRSVISPRFGIQQKNKLRPIDNFIMPYATLRGTKRNHPSIAYLHRVHTSHVYSITYIYVYTKRNISVYSYITTRCGLRLAGNDTAQEHHMTRDSQTKH